MGNHLQTEAVVPIFILSKIFFFFLFHNCHSFSLLYLRRGCIFRKLNYLRRAVAANVDWLGVDTGTVHESFHIAYTLVP